MTDYFISDLHLDETRPAATTAFLAFLAGLEARRLFILGDLFEAWVGDDHETELARAVADGLERCHARGTDLYFMAGNRDFLLGDSFAARCRLRALRDPATIRLAGRPAVLSHGDLFCTDDHAYQTFRAEVRDPAWIQRFLARPLAERLAFAAKARAESRRQTAGKADAIMDVNPDAVGRTMRRLGADLLIHGHTHRPAIHDEEREGCRRFVLGDWYEQGTILRADGDALRLETIGF